MLEVMVFIISLALGGEGKKTHALHLQDFVNIVNF